MNNSRVLGFLHAGMAAAILSVVGAGCGPSVTSYCDKVCDCMGCSETERADCVDDLGDYRKAADEEGCGGQFDAVLSCASSELVCRDDRIEVDGCDAEIEELNECSSGTVPVVNDVCQLAVDQIVAKYESCNIEVTPSGEDPPECTAELGQQSLCVAACLNATTCAVLNGEDQEGLSAYADCLGAC